MPDPYISVFDVSIGVYLVGFAIVAFVGWIISRGVK